MPRFPIQCIGRVRSLRKGFTKTNTMSREPPRLTNRKYKGEACCLSLSLQKELDTWVGGRCCPPLGIHTCESSDEVRYLTQCHKKMVVITPTLQYLVAQWFSALTQEVGELGSNLHSVWIRVGSRAHPSSECPNHRAIGYSEVSLSQCLLWSCST